MICYAVIDTNVLVSALLSYLEEVMEKRDDEAYLVTGNLKHFPTEPFIVTARQLLDILDGR